MRGAVGLVAAQPVSGSIVDTFALGLFLRQCRFMVLGRLVVFLCPFSMVGIRENDRTQFYPPPYLLNVVKTKALLVREVGALLLGLLAYSVLMCMLPEAYGNTFLYVFPLMRLPDFLLGICAFRLYEWLCGKELFHFRSVRKAATVCEFLAMALMVAACWAYYHVPENVSYAFLFWMPSVCFVVVFAFSSGCGGGVARILYSVFWVRLGNVSFTFYMVHQLCIRAGGTLWRACALPDCPALEYLSFFVLSCVSAYLLYHGVEKPLMCRWSQKWE